MIFAQTKFASDRCLYAEFTNDAALGLASSASQVFLVFGRTGWIGGLLGKLLKERGADFEYAQARLEDRAGVLADVERVRTHQQGHQSFTESRT